MDNPIVKYDQSVYQSKIARLEGCVQLLQGHLNTLEGLKGQVRSFWDDPQAPEYLRSLTTAIVGVRNAMDSTQKMLAEHRGTVEEMNKVTALTTGLVSDIGGVIGSLGIK